MAMKAFAAEASARLALYRGPLALRLTIDRTGVVASCDVLRDRVIHPDPGETEWQFLLVRLIEQFGVLRFPASEGETVAIQPVVFGGPLVPPT
jgi:hypothetical protein